MKLRHSTIASLLCMMALATFAQGKTMEEKKSNAVNVVCETTKGRIDIVVQPDWSPRGAARFLRLVDDGHFHDLPLFRCVENFLCQFDSMPPSSKASVETRCGQ